MTVRKMTFQEIDAMAECYSLGYSEETIKAKFGCRSIRATTKKLKKYYGTKVTQKLTLKRIAARTRYRRYCTFVRMIEFDDFVKLEKCFTAQTAKQLILQVQIEQLYNEMERLYRNKRLTETEQQECINLLKMKIIKVENEIEKEAKKAWRKSEKKAI